MPWLTIHMTRANRVPAPAPLPDITETPRSAFLAGWWGGIMAGSIIGASLMYLLLDQIGRLK